MDDDLTATAAVVAIALALLFWLSVVVAVVVATSTWTLRAHLAQTNRAGEECVICLEEFCERDVTYHVDCGHEFHATCFKTWMLERLQCPICRRECLALL